jgi:type III pantothenate kinase
MLLVIDVGNTNTTLGVYEGAQLVKHWRLTTRKGRTADEYGVYTRNLFALAGLDSSAITATAIASVVPPLNFTLRRMCEIYFQHTPLFIDHTTETGMPILYSPASDVGADRIVDSVAAIEKYGAPGIIVDFGTATTFDAVNRRGEYLGGVIAPGITISADALFERAARLPRVEIKRPSQVIGTNTVGAMQSGLYYGYVGLVDGILARIRDELLADEDANEAKSENDAKNEGAGRSTKQKVSIIATGGLAPLIATGSRFIETVDDTLTLEGMRLIYERAKK